MMVLQSWQFFRKVVSDFGKPFQLILQPIFERLLLFLSILFLNIFFLLILILVLVCELLLNLSLIHI